MPRRILRSLVFFPDRLLQGMPKELAWIVVVAVLVLAANTFAVINWI